MNSVQLQNVLHLIFPTLRNRKLEKYFAPGRISHTHYKSVEISVCVTEFSSSPCHDEVIVLSLPCDHLLTCILKKILETVPVVFRCLVNKPVVKWFVQRCTCRNHMQG